MIDLKFGQVEIEKWKFLNSKCAIAINNVDINKRLVPKKLLIAKIKNDSKSLMGYKNNETDRPMYIKLPQMDGYVNSFKVTKCMSLLIKDNQ